MSVAERPTTKPASTSLVTQSAMAMPTAAKGTSPSKRPPRRPSQRFVARRKQRSEAQSEAARPLHSPGNARA